MLLIFYILLIINGIVFIFSWINNIRILNKLHIFKKYKEILDKNINGSKLNNKKNDDIFVKILMAIVLLILAILLLGIATSMIWLPILIFLNISIEIGIISYLVISALFIIFDVNVLKNIGKNQKDYSVVEKTILREILKKVFAVQFIILVLVDYNLSFILFMSTVQEKSSIFTNTTIMLLGIIYVAVFVLSLYAYCKYIYLRYIDRKKKSIWKIKIWEILLVFIVSSFIAMIIITETYENYIPIDNVESFFRTFDVIKYIFTALLIPIMFKTFQNRNKYIISN